MTRIRARLLLLAATLVLWLPAGAQLHRGARTIVRGGLLEKPDSLRPKRDSAELARIILHYDSVATAGYLADSAAVSALRTAAISIRWRWPVSKSPGWASTPRPKPASSRKGG